MLARAGDVSGAGLALAGAAAVQHGWWAAAHAGTRAGGTAGLAELGCGAAAWPAGLRCYYWLQACWPGWLLLVAGWPGLAMAGQSWP